MTWNDPNELLITRALLRLEEGRGGEGRGGEGRGGEGRGGEGRGGEGRGGEGRGGGGRVGGGGGRDDCYTYSNRYVQ